MRPLTPKDDMVVLRDTAPGSTSGRFGGHSTREFHTACIDEGYKPIFTHLWRGLRSDGTVDLSLLTDEEVSETVCSVYEIDALANPEDAAESASKPVFRYISVVPPPSEDGADDGGRWAMRNHGGGVYLYTQWRKATDIRPILQSCARHERLRGCVPLYFRMRGARAAGTLSIQWNKVVAVYYKAPAEKKRTSATHQIVLRREDGTIVRIG